MAVHGHLLQGAAHGAQGAKNTKVYFSEPATPKKSTHPPPWAFFFFFFRRPLCFKLQASTAWTWTYDLLSSFAPRTPTAKKKLECDCRSKWAVVKIKIDDDCLHDDADNDDEWLTIPLNDRIYNSEGVDKGWTILAEEFVEYEQTQAAAAAAAAVRTVATEQEVVAAFYGRRQSEPSDKERYGASPVRHKPSRGTAIF